MKPVKLCNYQKDLDTIFWQESHSLPHSQVTKVHPAINSASEVYIYTL